MSGDANKVMKKILQKIVNHTISLKEFNEIEKVDVFFVFGSKHKTAMCDWVYGVKIFTDSPLSSRDHQVLSLQNVIKKQVDSKFKQSVCCTDVIFEKP
jgi:hypothetical protein